MSALIVENIKSSKGLEFDGMWSSSFIDSATKGKPDIETVDVSTRITTINEIFEVTTKPMIYDADTGGFAEHFIFTVRTLERTGISAVLIEDRKTFFSKESLLGQQESMEDFFYAKLKWERKVKSQMTL